MRENKYRGRRLDNGKWAYGSYIEAKMRDGSVCHEIVPYEAGAAVVEVDPKTVGQYTGLKDKNGREIFEGDIVRHDKEVSEVFFDTENACFWFRCSNDIFAAQFSDRYEVVGNIHDNSELLKI